MSSRLSASDGAAGATLASMISCSGLGSFFGALTSISSSPAVSSGSTRDLSNLDFVHVFSPQSSQPLQPLRTICRLEASVTVTSL
jgi:hypothetical protein